MDPQYAIAVEGIRNGIYQSVRQASIALGLSRTILTRRLKGGKTRTEAREAQQLLTCQEEKALVEWISQATATGNPVPHQYIREMVEEIRASRGNGNGEFLCPLGTTWMEAFLKRHPQLKTKLSKAIEASRLNDVTRDQIIAFNNEFRQAIQEKNIKLENIYNCDETGDNIIHTKLIVGSSIGACNGTNVVIDIDMNQSYMAQPGRQEWVTVIECISASGASIPPYVIFKGEHLVSTWVPNPPPPGWTFTTNTSGWTNNFHGVHWIHHFDKHMKSLLNSPDDYCLLLCDGHDSHVSAAVATYCLRNHIVLTLLPPHSSHLLQPLDVGIFSPLKVALVQRQTRLFRSAVRRIEKAEWAEHYMEARDVAITEKNILSAWRGAGLFPENLFHMLHQLPDCSVDISTPTAPAVSDISTPFFLTSSPPEPSTLRSTNQAFLSNFTTSNVNHEYKTHVRRLSGIEERLQTEVTILEKELEEIKTIHARRKERASGKRVILKGKAVISTEELIKALAEAEKATQAKKKKRKSTRKKKVLDSEGDTSDSEPVAPDSREDSTGLRDPEILDCIEVAL
jgi:hypothetical protein